MFSFLSTDYGLNYDATAEVIAKSAFASTYCIPKSKIADCTVNSTYKLKDSLSIVWRSGRTTMVILSLLDEEKDVI